jgi:hypothetical protein
LFAVNKCFKTLTTSIHQQCPHKNSKTIDSRNNFFGSAAILQTLGVKYELQWTLLHYDLVIGECPFAGFKTVKVKAAL